MADEIAIDLIAKDLTKTAFSSVTSSINALTSPIRGVTSVVGGMVTAFGRIGLAASGIKAVSTSIAGMAQGLLKGNASLEMTTISFKTLLGSAGAAQDMIKQLTSFAASTPFELAGLESSTQNLLAFGFGAKDIIPLMTSMGDAISALGGTQANLDSLVHVMGQMRQEAHINAGDIMQMTNLGIPALQMLADHYHVTTGQMQEMVSKGVVPGQEAIKIFSDGMEKRYGGMMAAQSATFSGMLSNLQDWASATTIILTKPFFEPAKKALAAFLNYVQSPAGNAAIQKLAGYIQTGVNKVIGAFHTLQPIVSSLANSFETRLASTIKLVSDRFNDALPSLEGFYQRIEPIVGKALELYKAISPISIILDTLKGILTGGLSGGLDAFEKHIVDAGKAFGLNLQPAIDWFNTTVVTQVIPTLQSWANTFLTDWWPKIQMAVGFVIKTVGDFATFVSVNVWPPVKAFLDWMGTQGKKIWDSVVQTVTVDVLPAIKKFGDYIATDLWPKLRDDVFPWIDKNVRPKLEKAFDIISTDIIPAIGKLVDTILNHVIPTLVAWWGVLFTLINPFLKTVGDTIDQVVLPALDKMFGSAKDNKKGIDGVIDGFKTFLGIVGQVVAGFHAIYEVMGGWLLETVIGNVGKLIQMLGLMGDTIDALVKGDYTRAVTDMTKVMVIAGAPGSNKISGNADRGEYPDNAAQKRLDDYKKTHPDYDPTKAGNTPKKALGDSSFMGGPVWWGEAGMERLQVPGGPTFYASGPVYTPNAPAGSKFTPMGDDSGYGGHAVNIYLTVHGNPDQAQLAQMKRVAKDAVKQGLSELKAGAVNQRSVNRTRG